MTAFVLWLYGLLVLASLIMVLVWGNAARELAIEHGRPWLALRWCKAFVIAGGLTLHAAAMAIACAYRAYDVLANARIELGSEVTLQIVILCALAASKLMFVWAGATDDAPRRIRWPWWAFLYALILWALTCWAWAAAR